MPSNKWDAWDFLSKDGQFFKKDMISPSFFITPDAYLSQALTDEIKLHHNVQPLLASELELSWFEEKFQGMSMFSLFEGQGENSKNQVFLVLESQNLSKEIISFLSDRHESQDWGEDKFLFIFTGKLPAPTKKFVDIVSKHHSVNEIKTPKFWENRKLFELFAKKFDLDFELEAKTYLLDILEKDSATYFNTFSALKPYDEIGKPISAKLVKSLIGKSHIEVFDLAKKFSQKRIKEFFKDLLRTDLDYDELRGVFFFLQNHAIKIYDPTYMKGKSRLSKYDEEIKNASKVWNNTDLEKWIDFFSECEIECKTKSFLMEQKIREAYIASL